MMDDFYLVGLHLQPMNGQMMKILMEINDLLYLLKAMDCTVKVQMVDNMLDMIFHKVVVKLEKNLFQMSVDHPNSNYHMKSKY